MSIVSIFLTFSYLHIVFLLLLILQNFQQCGSISIDNSVEGNPDVYCGPDTIAITFRTLQIFSGRTFIKGYVQEKDCVKIGDQQREQKFTVHVDQCGLRRSREYNGIRITTTVIISFHPIFITKVDRAYRLNCFYVESTKKVSQHLDVSILATEEIKKQTPMPVCRYDILKGGPDGEPARFVMIGDAVYHKWSCLSEVNDVYCMRVHTCTVDDGQGGESIQVLDKNGCSVDKFLLTNLDYISDLSAGQESHVFKFADRPALYFNCQLELLYKDQKMGCTRMRAQCISQIPQVKVTPSDQEHEKVMTPAEFENEAGDLYYDANIPTRTDESVSTLQVPTENNEAASSPFPLKLVPPGPPGSLPSEPYSKESSDESQESSGYVSGSGYEIPVTDSISQSYEESNSYDRLIRRKRRPGSRKSDVPNDTLPIITVDLPERMLTVFGVDNGALPSEKELEKAVQPVSSLIRRCRAPLGTILPGIMVTSLLAIIIVILINVIVKQRQLIHRHFAQG